MSGNANTPFFSAVIIKATPEPEAFSLYRPLPLFRREFEITDEIESAEMFVVSPGFGRFFINGREITDDVFITPLSNYDKLLWYNRYDVTALVKKGKNAAGAIAGNGFFNEPFKTPWDYNKSPWLDAPQILVSLRVNGVTVLDSDASWRVNRELSPIIYSQIRSGEYVDARLACDDWLKVGYDDSGWQSVICKPFPGGIELKPTQCPPVREVERVEPKRIEKSARGYLIDFGKNLSGYIGITVKEKRGTELSFRYCEETDKHGNPRYAYIFYHESSEDADIGADNMTHSRFYPDSPFQLDKLIASGGTDFFKPSFCYHGFRYVEIIGLSRKPEHESVCAYVIRNDVKRTASFTSGNDVLNFIYEAGIRSVQSNTFWSLTDCPTREKLGWTNDAAATCEQALINFELGSLFEKWFTDLKLDMRDDGSLPGIIPSNGWGDDWGPVCDNLLFELPYRTYLYTGDKKMLVESIPYFERYVKFLCAKKRDGYEFILGDWMGCGNSELTPKELVRDCFLLEALRVTAFAHSLNGTDGSAFGSALDELKNELIDTYVMPDGTAKVTSQTSLSMLLRFNIYRDKSKIAEQLVKTVEKDEFKLTCGMVGFRYLYDALTECGRPEYALKLITESEPGYKGWYSLGATTLWECWDGNEKGSHNHHMFSGVIAWFFKSLVGINLDEKKPGYARIELKPCLIAKVGFVKASVDTPYGRLSAEWSYADGEFTYVTDIPNGIEAELNGKKLKNGINVIRIK